LRILVSLLDKSLIRRTAGNRYTLHPLLGQFSYEKLANQPLEADCCRSRHARYFANFLNQRKDDLERSRQLEALAEMDAERENLRAAYAWMLESSDLESIDLAMEAFLAYLDVRCHSIEAMVTAERTQQLLEPLATAGNCDAQRLLGVALVYHAMFRAFEYDNDVALDLARRALVILEEHSERASIAFAHNILGLAQLQRGEMDAALGNFETAVMLRKALGKDALVASSLINIAQIAWRRGEYTQAEAVSRAALESARKSGNLWRLAMAFNVLGILAKEMKRYDEAMRNLQDSIEAYQAVGNRWGIASVISETGIIAYYQQAYSVARSHLERSIVIRRELGNIIHRAGDLIWLGRVAEAQDEIAEAEGYYTEALALLEPMDEPVNKASATFLLACLHARQNPSNRADLLEKLNQAWQLAIVGDSQLLAEEIAVEIAKLQGTAL
jgi:tetratricopeptide (TPR) repeat protein